MSSLDDLVEQWLRMDQNDASFHAILKLRDEGAIEELEKRMRPRIEFGTAGLRGKMEAGWARMNDLIIIQASQGLCAYVLDHIKDAASRGIVIGHDHRHNSERWAKLTAMIFISSGVKVYLYKGLVHTPMVPFGIKELNAACGVMVTASHNPKHDNGYKVYWENAVQIIGPHDIGIADSINKNLEPKAIWDTQEIVSSPLCVDVTEKMREAYFIELSNMNRTKSLNLALNVKFVNTSMHGVSDSFVRDAFSLFGFGPYIPVQEQQIPDPEFPTVQYPNPEEKGAMDLALATAEREDAFYVLAQDPDSDRFSAAERNPNGGWIQFTGDQLGTLFASQILAVYKASGKPIEKLALVASAVSSKMIEAMAATEGFKFVECLTGFKYIGNTALDLVRQGYEVPFGYEEAIGYMFGSHIRDKDGVAATVSFAELVAFLSESGNTVNSQLQNLYEKYGYFQTCNSYFICSNPTIINAIFSRLRHFNDSDDSEQRKYPTEIAGLKITRVIDATFGYDSANPPTYASSLPVSRGHMIQWRAENKTDGTAISLTLRISGTEPKIKYYLEGSGKNSSIVTSLLLNVESELAESWVEESKHNIKRP